MKLKKIIGWNVLDGIKCLLGAGKPWLGQFHQNRNNQTNIVYFNLFGILGDWRVDWEKGRVTEGSSDRSIRSKRKNVAESKIVRLTKGQSERRSELEKVRVREGQSDRSLQWQTVKMKQGQTDSRSEWQKLRVTHQCSVSLLILQTTTFYELDRLKGLGDVRQNFNQYFNWMCSW